MKNLIIAIASDHAGFELKEQLISYLEQKKYQIIDLGCSSKDSVDYPDYANKLVDSLKEQQVLRGILICGTGIGMSVAANRFNHIRAALCTNSLMAKFAREHNDANVLVLGARIIDQQTALDCVKSFLSTEFTETRHQLRIDKLARRENNE